MKIQGIADQLSGKVAIVTGGGSPEGGIGRAIARTLAAAGAKLCVVDLDLARAAEVAQLIEADSGTALAIAGDASKIDDCRAIVGQAVEAFGGVDILVNNVGISQTAPPPLVDTDFDRWSHIIDTNLKSALAMSGFAIRSMIERGGGAIVNIASIAGMQAYGGTAYGPSKAALIQLTRETAVIHGPDGIRANVVAPGHVNTAHIAHIFTEAERAARRNVGPLGIEGDASDIAQAVLFLASDASRFITGVLLPVDGGVTMIGPLAGSALLNRRA